MKRALFLALLSASLAGPWAVNSWADQSPETAPPAKAPKPKAQAFSGKIKAIDQLAKTITLEGEKAQILQITSETRIFKDKKPAILSELSVGEEVSGRARETATNSWEALTVTAGKQPARPAKAKQEPPPTTPKS